MSATELQAHVRLFVSRLQTLAGSLESSGFRKRLLREAAVLEKRCNAAHQSMSYVAFIGEVGDVQAQIRNCLQWLDHVQEIPQMPQTFVVEVMDEGRELLAITAAIIDEDGDPHPQPPNSGGSRVR